MIDVTEQLRRQRVSHFADQVYAASHARAIVDTVIMNALKESKWYLVVYSDLDGWMPSDEDKKRVFDLIDAAIARLPSANAAYVSKWKDTILELLPFVVSWIAHIYSVAAFCRIACTVCDDTSCSETFWARP